MKPFIVRWLATTLAVAIAAQLVPGIHAGNGFSLFAVALFLGIVNAFVRPVLLLLCLPLIIVSLGVFIFVLNALLFWVASGLVPDFRVEGFWSALGGSLVVSVVCWALSAFFRGSDGRVYPITHHTQLKNVRGRVVE